MSTQFNFGYLERDSGAFGKPFYKETSPNVMPASPDFYVVKGKPLDTVQHPFAVLQLCYG